MGIFDCLFGRPKSAYSDDPILAIAKASLKATKASLGHADQEDILDRMLNGDGDDLACVRLARG